MSKRVICYIQAFDCEKTIEAAMESIRNQTYDNWLCFVLSNGNKNTVETPNYTFDVIKGVAARDRRFVVLKKRNNSIDMYIPMLYRLASGFPDSYICSLDADDVYEPDFFERAIEMAEKDDLDIVCCGTKIVLKKCVDEIEEKLLSTRALEKDTVFRGTVLGKNFAVYKPFFNEMWGKLYDARLFGKEYNERYARKNFFKRFLPDTLFTIDTLSRANAIGVLGGTSHKFYQFEKRSATNASVAANEKAANKKGNNIFSVYDTHDRLCRYLSKYGEIGDEQYEYLQAVLFGWFWDHYSRTIVSTTDEKKLVSHVSKLVFDPKFDELMSYRGSGKYRNVADYTQRIAFCGLIKNTLLGQEVIRNRKVLWLEDLKLSFFTSKKIDGIIRKLDETTDTLKRLQEEQNA